MPSSVASLPREALGLGLRPAMYSSLFSVWPELGYLEIISENFLSPAAYPQYYLALAQSRYPIVLHGVSLNLLGGNPLDEKYVESLCRLADKVDAPFVSDHLCWSGAHGVHHHDLLPTPYTSDLVGYVAERIDYVQQRLQRPFAIENLSSYLSFSESEMAEWEFLNRILAAADCWCLLDINNIYVSSQNHGFDPYEYLRSIPFHRVAQVHLAGHEQESQGMIIDTHDCAVAEPVWQLYHQAWQLGGPFPTLLEWDSKLPPLEGLLEQLVRAQQVRS